MSDDAQRAQDRARFSLQGKALADLGQQVVRARAENRELRRRLASVEAVLAAVKRQVEACEGALRFYAAAGEDGGVTARQVLYKAPSTGDGATGHETEKP